MNCHLLKGHQKGANSLIFLWPGFVLLVYLFLHSGWLFFHSAIYAWLLAGHAYVWVSWPVHGWSLACLCVCVRVAWTMMMPLPLVLVVWLLGRRVGFCCHRSSSDCGSSKPCFVWLCLCVSVCVSVFRVWQSVCLFAKNFAARAGQ